MKRVSHWMNLKGTQSEAFECPEGSCGDNGTLSCKENRVKVVHGIGMKKVPYGMDQGLC